MVLHLTPNFVQSISLLPPLGRETQAPTPSLEKPTTLGLEVPTPRCVMQRRKARQGGNTPLRDIAWHGCVTWRNERVPESTMHELSRSRGVGREENERQNRRRQKAFRLQASLSVGNYAVLVLGGESAETPETVMPSTKHGYCGLLLLFCPGASRRVGGQL